MLVNCTIRLIYCLKQRFAAQISNTMLSYLFIAYSLGNIVVRLRQCSSSSSSSKRYSNKKQ